jgi:hypothetical protein
MPGFEPRKPLLAAILNALIAERTLEKIKQASDLLLFNVGNRSHGMYNLHCFCFRFAEPSLDMVAVVGNCTHLILAYETKLDLSPVNTAMESCCLTSTALLNRN